MAIVTHHFTALASGVNVHYASAKPPAPKFTTPRTILLLHGFPTSSNQYRFLIPRLAEEGYTVFAPDLPGFGNTTVPEQYEWTFKSLATAIGDWLDELHVTDFAAYIFDYGAPVFFRLFNPDGSLASPRFRIRGIITQNGNLYEDGLGMPYWGPRRKWWANGDVNSSEHRAITRVVLSNPLKGQYVNGTPEDRLDRLDPTTWMSDYRLNIQGNEERLLDLFFDYGDNVRLYPQWQAWLRSSGIPILAMWGKNDPSFIPPGAEAIKKDVPETQVAFLDGGHFVLETHLEEALGVMIPYLSRIRW